MYAIHIGWERFFEFCLIDVGFLLRFWQLAHGAQAARANVHIARDAIDFKTAMLHIQYETTARALL